MPLLKDIFFPVLNVNAWTAWLHGLTCETVEPIVVGTTEDEGTDGGGWQFFLGERALDVNTVALGFKADGLCGREGLLLTACAF